jgi:predicted RNA-binding protein YlxR (DUF448 family)
MCAACRVRKPQADMLRVATTKQGTFTFGRGEGRGAYLCKSEACIELALKARKFEQGFRKKLGEGEKQVIETWLRSQLR